MGVAAMAAVVVREKGVRGRNENEACKIWADGLSVKGLLLGTGGRALPLKVLGSNPEQGQGRGRRELVLVCWAVPARLFVGLAQGAQGSSWPAGLAWAALYGPTVHRTPVPHGGCAPEERGEGRRVAMASTRSRHAPCVGLWMLCAVLEVFLLANALASRRGHLQTRPFFRLPVRPSSSGLVALPVPRRDLISGDTTAPASEKQNNISPRPHHAIPTPTPTPVRPSTSRDARQRRIHRKRQPAAHHPRAPE